MVVRIIIINLNTYMISLFTVYFALVIFDNFYQFVNCVPHGGEILSSPIQCTIQCTFIILVSKVHHRSYNMFYKYTCSTISLSNHHFLIIINVIQILISHICVWKKCALNRGELLLLMLGWLCPLPYIYPCVCINWAYCTR